MGIYIITWVFFTLASIIEVNRNGLSKSLWRNFRHFLTLISFSILVFQVGLRWETGTDWTSYKDFFDSLRNPTIALAKVDDFEFGYVLFNWLVHLISHNYSTLLVIHAMIFWGLMIKLCKFLTPNFILAIFLYYFVFVGMTGSNRQLLAIVISLYGVMRLMQGYKKEFFLFVFFAFLFHTSALLTLLYFFLNRKIKNSVLFLAVIVAALIGYSSLPAKLFEMSSVLGAFAAKKSQAYLELANTSEHSVLGLSKKIILPIIFILSSKKLGELFPRYYLCLNGFIVSTVFFFLFMQVPIMSGRALLYFNFMEPILLVYLIYLFKSSLSRNMVVVALSALAAVYFVQSIQMYPDLFLPYKGIFINSDFIRKELY